MNYNKILLLLTLLLPITAKAFNDNKGEKSNIVCFVRFADEDADIFDKPLSNYQTLFGGEKETDNSVYNYFYNASYKQLKWKSLFLPATETELKSYRTSYERAYYQKYDASIRPTGYKDDVAGEARMQALVREIAGYLSKDMADKGASIDTDGDGFVDNLCIIFSGNSELSAKRGILWPQRKDLALPEEKAIYIAGKKLASYIMVFDGANGFNSQFDGITLNTGVLCHEMSHSLGTYDLYHVSGALNPVGVWDLMSDNQITPQGMTAYTKMRYCKWIDQIPEIKEAGTYTLNPLSGTTTDKIAYKIKPVGSDEYFVVEYRKKEGCDANLPASGLIIYRICPQYTGGNVNYNGTTRLDEQYIFRPGGTVTADGDISKAAFSIDNGRPSFGGDADIRPFYSDGKEAPFAITDISSCGETISFTLQPITVSLKVDNNNVAMPGFADCSATVKVYTTEEYSIIAPTVTAEWLTVETVKEADGDCIKFTTKTDNDTPKDRNAIITVKTKSGEEVHISVIQKSKSVTAPSALKAELTGNTVHLTWSKATAGERLIYDDFENSENPNAWEIKTSGDRGWRWEKCNPDKGFYRSYEGNYAATVYAAWEDIHQDEYFTSKAFANGNTMTFYSRTNGAGRTPANPPYYNVEVSSDNGATWTPVFNARTDQDKATAGKYTRITIDLTPYKAEQMKVRFHCYDTDNTGLAYYWQIDNLEIMGEGDLSITGYDIYRNSEKIAHTATNDYIDQAPSVGDNIYTVCAVGNFGESSPSNAVTINVSSTGIHDVNAAPSVTAIYDITGRKLRSRAEMQSGKIYIVIYSDGNVMKIAK